MRGAGSAGEAEGDAGSTPDWSCEPLHGPEEELFGRLSVFAGGLGLEAAEAVGAEPGTLTPLDAADVVLLLGNLVERSLVVAQAEEEEEDGIRYGMLEPVGQYAATREQHAGYKTPRAGGSTSKLGS